MSATEQQTSRTEAARRGRAVYERLVRPHLHPGDDGKFVALDRRTGEYELDADELPAVRRLRSRLPDADVLLLCVGQPGTYRI